MFELVEHMGLESLHVFSDPSVDLRVCIAIHSTLHGPALGGTRCVSYASEHQAIEDACRLARGMSYKAAMAELPLGGGKAVIIRPAHMPDRQAFFEAYGRMVERLGGQYITSLDSGTSVQDLAWVANSTRYVAGNAAHNMDPSPATARGVFVGIQAALQHLDGKNDLSGIHVALQGVGHVGMALAGRLHEAGAFLTLADVDADRAAEAAERFGARVVGVDAIHAVEADVFSPCALGGVITHDNLNDLRCRVVAGSANNQLSHQGRGMGLALKQRGILYAPDYVINAGGLIQVGMATLGHDQTATDEKIDRIARTLSGIFAEADARALDTETLTQQLAEKILREPIHD